MEPVWSPLPSPERYIDTEIEGDAASVQSDESDKDSSMPSPKIEEREFDIKSEDKFDSGDELLPIRVPKVVFDKAAVRLIDDLRKELRVRPVYPASLRWSLPVLQTTKSLLFTKSAEVEELQRELSDAKALIVDMQSREGDEAEAEATATSDESQTTSRQRPENLPQRCLSRVQRLPSFRGKHIKHPELTHVSFISADLCRQMGWERTFQDKFEAFSLPANRVKKHLYIPGRTTFVNYQHALAIVPKTQTNSEHDFELLSPFDEVYGEERVFFFDRTARHQNEQDVFYAGTYQIVSLNDICPEGVALKDLNRRFRKQHAIDCIVDSIADAQMQRPLLGKNEIKKLVQSGDIKLDLVGLQCVGFDEDLYERMTRGAGKRKQPAGHDHDGPEGSHPQGKRRKVD
ncbi:hypothetical protein VNI00_017471 [Paramarasmius palmivorus]|uniref:DUF6697 domain-containing protein n=1 Tax=Paramarasmius palmivorus TaxID=297713 RepID=A0AAW0B972_9AGAR